MDASPNITLDLKFPLQPIFTNGFAFYQALVASTQRKPPGLIQISTYNTSINEGMTELVGNTLGSLADCATEIQLLVGINPHHMQLGLIRTTLSTYAKKIPKLKIRELRGVHMKCFLTPTCGYAGSLNLIHPTLDDLMVRLSTQQRQLVSEYFSRLWNRAEGGIVQKLHRTQPPICN